METVTANVTSWTMFFLEGLMFHSLEFLVHFETFFAHALIFNELSSEPGSTVPVPEQRMDLKCSRNGLQSIGMGC
jgi:hypothetical protein